MKKRKKNYATNLNKKFKKIRNLNFKVVNLAVTQFATQFTHVSRNLGPRIENKNLSLGKNCFENVVSD